MSESTKEELEKMAKEKADAAKKAASEAANKIKNMSSDEAKELAKEKADQAKKAAAEAADKLKNMSADEAKEMAKEKLESMKSLDNNAKLKYGGIALLVILVVYFIFSGSSYNEEYLKHKLKEKNLELISFDIKDEKESEILGHTIVDLKIDAKYKTLAFTCEREVGDESAATPYAQEPYSKWNKQTFYTKTEEKCLKMYGNVKNQKVTAKPGAEVTKTRTVTYDDKSADSWVKNHSK